jgi:hypothetical protein
MKVAKLSVSFEGKLGTQVKDAARKARAPVSSWLAQAAVAKLRADQLGDFLDDWEEKHGKLTEQELAQAAQELAPKKKPRR